MLRAIKRFRVIIPSIPPKSPELGNLPQIKQAGSINNFILNSMKELNTDIFMYWLHNTRNVCIAHPKYFKAISKLGNKGEEENYILTPVVGRKSILMTNKPDFSRMKQYFYSIFSTKNIRHYHFKHIQSVISEWTLPNVQSSINQSQPVIGLDLGLGTSFRTIMQTTFGKENAQDPERCSQFIDCVNKIWNELGKSLISGRIQEGTQRYQRLAAAKAKLDEFSLEIIENYQKSNEATIFAQQLIQGQEQEEILDQIRTIIIGGTHTTGHLLNWIFYFLAKYPNFQEQLHKELDTLGDYEILNYSKIFRLTFTRNLIDETLRFTTFFSKLRRQNLEGEIELPGGYILENQDNVHIMNLIIFRHPDFWYKPDEFNPNRFLKSKSRGLHFQPFGFQGGRVCPGSNLANMEITGVLGSIFKKYKVQFDQEQKEVSIMHNLNAFTSEDVLLRFTER